MKSLKQSLPLSLAFALFFFFFFVAQFVWTLLQRWPMKVRSLSPYMDFLFKYNKCGDDVWLSSQLASGCCRIFCSQAKGLFKALLKGILVSPCHLLHKYICQDNSDLGHFVLPVSLTYMIKVKYYITQPTWLALRRKAELKLFPAEPPENRQLVS